MRYSVSVIDNSLRSLFSRVPCTHLHPLSYKRVFDFGKMLIQYGDFSSTRASVEPQFMNAARTVPQPFQRVGGSFTSGSRSWPWCVVATRCSSRCRWHARTRPSMISSIVPTVPTWARCPRGTSGWCASEPQCQPFPGASDALTSAAPSMTASAPHPIAFGKSPERPMHRRR